MILNRVIKKFNLLVLLFFITFIQLCHSNVCPLFQCSPEIASLDHNSINSTFEIKCTFTNKVQDPTDLIWKFHLGKMERIINDLDGGILPPFSHQVLNLNNPNNNHENSISILKVNLINSSYFTNYTIMNIRDMCQQTIRIHLQERALGYTNKSSKFNLNQFLQIFWFLCLLICKLGKQF